MFSDVIADAQADDKSSNDDNFIEGFKLALQEWREYYEEIVYSRN